MSKHTRTRQLPDALKPKKRNSLEYRLHRYTPKEPGHPAKVITDLNFADDIALLSDTLLEAQNPLSRVGRAAAAAVQDSKQII